MKLHIFSSQRVKYIYSNRCKIIAIIIILCNNMLLYYMYMRMKTMTIECFVIIIYIFSFHSFLLLHSIRFSSDFSHLIRFKHGMFIFISLHLSAYSSEFTTITMIIVVHFTSLLQSERSFNAHTRVVFLRVFFSLLICSIQ